MIKKTNNANRIFVCIICNTSYKPIYSYQKTCANRKCANKAWHQKVQKDPVYKQKHALWQRNRKHKIRANGGNVTIGEWEDIKLKQNFICNICLKKEPEIILTQDHIIGIKDGGKHVASNIQGLCITCNIKKG